MNFSGGECWLKADAARARPVVIQRHGADLPTGALSELVRSVLERGRSVRFRAKGSSMSPFIRHGDVITVRPMSSSVHVGNIAAFIDPDTCCLKVHRIMAIGAGSYLIKADNGVHTDGWIPSGNVIGRVSRIERQGRNIRMGLGWECWLIAWLSRMRLLLPTVEVMRILHRSTRLTGAQT